MKILSQYDYNYYKLVNYPITMVHRDWIFDLTGINQACFKQLVERHSTRNHLNNILKQGIQVAIEEIKDNRLNKNYPLYQFIGKMKVLAICGGLFESQCPDYLFSSKYRNNLINEIGYLNVKQLYFYWQGGERAAGYVDTKFCSELLKHGSGNLEWLFFSDPLWKIAKYLLPKSGEIKTNHIDVIFMSRLNRILFPYEDL